MQVRFEPEKLRPFPSNAPHTFTDQKLGIAVTLNPGLNEVTEDELVVIQSNPSYPLHEQWRTIEVIEAPKPAAKPAPTPKP